MSRINIQDYMSFPDIIDEECEEIESNQERRDEMLEAFTLYDRNGDGLIDTKEIGTVIRSLGQVLTVCEETDIVAQYAQEECYDIDYRAFVNLMKNKKRVFDDDDDELRESFRLFDKEENGYVDVENLKWMLTNIGEPLAKSEVKQWMEDGEDFIRDGKLFYEDFATFMLSK